MATVSQLPASLNLVCTVGNDFTLTLAVLENSVAWVSTGATLSTDIYSRDGTVVATDFTTAATDGQVTLTLTDANTTTLGVGVYSYRLSVTKSGNTRDWIAGTLSVVEAGIGGTTSSAASLSITTGAVSLSTTTLVAPAAANISVADAGGYYTGTTVEAVLAEVGPYFTAPTKVWSHSKTWDIATGAAAYSSTALGVSGQRQGGVLFDGSTLESMYAFVPLPAVTTFDLWLVWANPSVTAGDVVWQAQYEFLTPSETMDLFTTGNQITATSPAQNVVAETRLLSGVSRGTATSMGVKILRRGDVAGDTINAVDVAAIAFRIEAAT
jgi:hypothetical protein